MKTTTTKQQLLEDYFLEAVDFTGYDNLENTMENVFNTCLSEYGHIKNDFTRCKEWALGLRGCLNIVFSYHDISQLMQSFGYKTKDVYKLNDMYWNFLAKTIVESVK